MVRTSETLVDHKLRSGAQRTTAEWIGQCYERVRIVTNVDLKKKKLGSGKFR